jgi:hypothetical protein
VDSSKEIIIPQKVNKVFKLKKSTTLILMPTIFSVNSMQYQKLKATKKLKKLKKNKKKMIMIKKMKINTKDSR